MKEMNENGWRLTNQVRLMGQWQWLTSTGVPVKEPQNFQQKPTEKRGRAQEMRQLVSTLVLISGWCIAHFQVIHFA